MCRFCFQTELWENIEHPFYTQMFAGPSLCRFIFDWLVELTGKCRLNPVFDSPKLKILTSSHSPNLIIVAQKYMTKLMVILNFKCKAQIFASSIAK
jgi:hypothetical protein